MQSVFVWERNGKIQLFVFIKSFGRLFSDEKANNTKRDMTPDFVPQSKKKKKTIFKPI